MPTTSLEPPTVCNTAIRNIAIIAHVDHGKTTLVDSMFKQSGIYRDNEQITERAMDSNDLERERGITILAKNTAIPYKDYKINIIDTPGHADFSGEVERTMTMVDGVLLIVDAVEGPMPQTRFVLRKALALGVKVILVINKIDRPAADCDKAIDRVIDLFIELGAHEDQLDFPIVYASGIAGTATLDLKEPNDNLIPLFDMIIDQVPPSPGDKDAPLQLQVSTLDYNDYIGRIIIGRVRQGIIKTGQQIMLMQDEGKSTQYRVTKLFGFQGLKRTDIEMAEAGDIVAVGGIQEAQIGDTIAGIENPVAMTRITVEEPTLKMTFGINTSPLSGREGQFVTSRQIKDRLEREIKSNISLRVEDGPTADTFYVSGRGELHLSILIETMRREGYEFQIGKPEVLTKEIDGQKMEPYEDLILDVPDEALGGCVEILCARRGEILNMESASGRTLVSFYIPSRGLLGFRSDFIRITKGEGMMTHAFKQYDKWAGEFKPTRTGSLIAHEPGDATSYALKSLEDRGKFFIGAGATVYRGMLVGINSRGDDLVINVCKQKKMTNIRSAGQEVLDVLTTPIDVSLEYGLNYIGDDEMMEVTPKNIRLRKANLNVK